VRTAGQLIWSNLTESEDLLKVMLREPDELGDLDEKTWQVITDNAYQRFADELAASIARGRTASRILRRPRPSQSGRCPTQRRCNR